MPMKERPSDDLILHRDRRFSVFAAEILKRVPRSPIRTANALRIGGPADAVKWRQENIDQSGVPEARREGRE